MQFNETENQKNYNESFIGNISRVDAAIWHPHTTKWSSLSLSRNNRRKKIEGIFLQYTEQSDKSGQKL